MAATFERPSVTAELARAMIASIRTVVALAATSMTFPRIAGIVVVPMLCFCFTALAGGVSLDG